VAFQVAPSLSGYDDQRGTQFYVSLLDRLRSAPGVKAVGLASMALLTGGEWDDTVSVEGHRAADGEDMQAYMNAVSPGYFDAMRIPVLDGRDFRLADVKENSKVAIVNHRFAEHFFPGQSAVGRHLGLDSGPEAKLDIEIVGVVADSLYEGPRQGIHRQVFLPNWGRNSAIFYVRTQTRSAATFAQVRRDVQQLDAAMPVYGMKAVQSQLDEMLVTDRLTAFLAAGFGLLATLLAAVGLYGVIAFVVARRTKEIGVRLALGSRPDRVVWLLMKEVLVLLAGGLAAGVPAALLSGRFVGSQLFGIEPRDPTIASATLLVLTLVVAAAGFIPANKASRIDPILALRCE
jgi:predicted permease